MKENGGKRDHTEKKWRCEVTRNGEDKTKIKETASLAWD